MKKLSIKRQGGFTIIEVMIVLAIAGLIMAIVFIAVPQLQRNTRDNQRQNLTARVKTELESFSANNAGTYPFAGVSATWTDCTTSNVTHASCYDFYNRYLNGSVTLTDPSTGANTGLFFGNAATNPTWVQGRLWIGVGDICNGDSLAAGSATGSATSKQYAVLEALDRSNTFYCVSNG